MYRRCPREAGPARMGRARTGCNSPGSRHPGTCRRSRCYRPAPAPPTPRLAHTRPPEIPERRLAETHAYTLPCDWMTTGDMRGVCQGRARRDRRYLLEIEGLTSRATGASLRRRCLLSACDRSPGPKPTSAERDLSRPPHCWADSRSQTSSETCREFEATIEVPSAEIAKGWFVPLKRHCPSCRLGPPRAATV